jgi:hypothetical protein
MMPKETCSRLESNYLVPLLCLALERRLRGEGN